MIFQKEKIKVTKESLPIRCELCHQSDCYDPVSNSCLRCKAVLSDQLELIRETSRSTPDTKQIIQTVKVKRAVELFVHAVLLTCLIYITTLGTFNYFPLLLLDFRAYVVYILLPMSGLVFFLSKLFSYYHWRCPACQSKLPPIRINKPKCCSSCGIKLF